jgi:hypothetical protein
VEKVNVPDAPRVLPKSLQAKWKETYEKEYLIAARNENLSADDCHRAAAQFANRMLAVEAPQSYQEAMEMAPWTVHASNRDEVRAGTADTLKIVTIDGRKYSFKAPRQAKSAEKPAANGGGEKSAA